MKHELIHFALLVVVLGTTFGFAKETHWSGKNHLATTNQAIASDSSQPPIEIKFRQMRFGRPPLVYLSFDLILRNDQESHRWFLIPSNLGSGHGAIGEKGGVDTLEVFSPRGKGRVVIGRFLGTAGFNALLLPARAEVRMRLFPISYWGDPPDNLEIEIVIAKQLTIGGDRAEQWFGKSPISSAKVDITEDAENTMRMRTAKRTSDNKEVAPQIEEDRRVTVKVSLEKKD